MPAPLTTYAPLITSVTSLLTALAVAGIGFRMTRSVESNKARNSYINYALQKVMDEYSKYDPIIEISEITQGEGFVRLVEARFKECRASIQRVAPLFDQCELGELNEISKKHSDMIKKQANEKLAGTSITDYDVSEYLLMLTLYINSGHDLLKNKIISLRNKLDIA